ncbi:MAG TPA: hypothetical protein GXX30_04550 [Firmicutes bacterium]|nr:hypothetical protein [Candidatus Fermentithermobacillaceae bacterium]
MGNLPRVIYVGIDDTDNLESRGTGRQARSLARELEEAGLGTALGVTRHQLLVDSRIPYTSHNSSACLTLLSDADVDDVVRAAAAFIRRAAAPGSDPGLCIAEAYSVRDTVVAFGQRAKSEVLTMNEAAKVAKDSGIHLSGHGGTNGGIIGALAGVGLRHSGADGRFLWLPGIREVRGVLSVEDLTKRCGITQFRRMDVASDALSDVSNEDMPAPHDTVDVEDWCRPVLLDGEPTLLVLPVTPRVAGVRRWHIVDRDVIKKY